MQVYENGAHGCKAAEREQCVGMIMSELLLLHFQALLE